MAKPNKKPGEGAGVRQAIEGLSRGPGGNAEPPPEPPERRNAAIEIGARPVEEDNPMSRDIHLFGVSNVDRAIFCRQLATLIEVGIPLLRALQMLGRRTRHPKLAAAIRRVSQSVEQGQSLSGAVVNDARTFSPLVVNMIRVGETGGILEESLVRLAQVMESKAEINRKVFSAMMYPLVALAVAFGVVVLILVKAVPIFTQVYGYSGQELPALTQFVIDLSDGTRKWAPLWVPLLAASIVGFRWFSWTPPGRRFNSMVSLRFPVVSRISQKVAVARFSRTLGGLLTAGVPLVETIQIAADTNENVLVADALRGVHKGVQRGDKMSRHIAASRVFPPLVVDMIGIGEETGTLDRMLEKIADIYDADVDATLRGLSSILEPVLIILLGGVVIFLALAVMLPYFSLAQAV